jgi:hypothetical protein
MKRFSLLALVLALFTLPVFAGSSKTETITLGSESKVAGTTLPAGEYKLVVSGTGSAVQVELIQKTVARPAKVSFNATFTAKKNPYITTTVDSQSGVNVLTSIQLRSGDITPANATSTGN